MAKTPTLSPTGQLAADRIRIKTILESPAGLRNPTAARKLALVDNLSAATALDVLAALPAESPYLAALAHEAPPVIGGPAAGTPGADDSRETRRAKIAESARHFNISKGYVTAPEGYKAPRY